MQLLLLSEVNGGKLIYIFRKRQIVFSVSYQDTLKQDPKQRKWFQPVLWGDILLLIRKWRFMLLQNTLWPQNTFLYLLQKNKLNMTVYCVWNV